MLVPLNELLPQLEERYEVRFSYATQAVADQTVAWPTSELSFRESLHLLRLKTQLIFTSLGEDIVTISRPQPSKQLLCGVVYDAYQQPLAQVDVLAGNQQTQTDALGYFYLEVPSTVSTIRLLRDDLQPQQLEFPAASACAEIVMQALREELQAVVITNYLTKGISKENDGSIHIEYEEFGVLPGLIESDVLLTVQALPGIQSVNEGVSRINIRGGTHDQNLLLWDGIKMYQSGHFFGLISAFNPYITAQVDVYKNGTPASLGDAVSGTLSMQSEETIDQQLGGAASVNLISADAFLNLPITKNGSLLIAGRKSLNEVWESPTYSSFFERAFQDTEITDAGDQVSTGEDRFSFYDVNFRYLQKLGTKTRLRINGLLVSNTLSFSENANIAGQEVSRESKAEQNNLGAAVYLDHRWDHRWSSDLLITASSYELAATNFDIFNNQRLIQQNQVLETSVKSVSRLKSNDRWTHDLGYQFTETGITNTSDVNNPLVFRKIKNVVRAHGLFGESAWNSPDKKTFARIGLRANYYNKPDVYRLEPRIVLGRRLLDHFRVEVQGELKSQTTSQVVDFQNDFLGVENRRWIISDEDRIPLLSSQQISIGGHYNRNTILISAEAFYKRVDGITGQSQGFLNQYEFLREQGSYEIKGLEFLFDYKWRDVGIWLGYTLATNQYDFDDTNEFEFPELFYNNVDVRHYISFSGSYTLMDRFKLAIGLNWHSGKPTTPLNDLGTVNPLEFGTANSQRLPDYFKVDFSANYTYDLDNDKKLYAGISVWNLTSNENIINEYYRVDSNDNISLIRRTGLGFTPNAVLRFSF
ncbi:TonB-dependent receptor plug domain-containing protein [Croceiramulus getboli]|nr:TonB-dependent receptor plug domain-containing protein [Flavobacteriaceae bacterium YJPT1-3]